jgi:2-phosphoglycerate kinase
MNNLYIIGGSTRSGKTTILNKVIMVRPMIAVQTDAIREGMRRALIDESSVTINELSFSGDVTFHRLSENNDISHTKHFSQKISQDDLTWNAVVGLINYYDDKGVDLIIEGMVITPERVKSLSFFNFKIKAAFVGITKDTNLNTILEQANLNKDWIYKKIGEHSGDNSVIKKAFNEEIEKSKKVAVMANEYGYKFFSLKNDDFEGYCNNVANYFLE